MVRIIAGTLIEVGRGKVAPDDMKNILAAQNRQAAGFTAPAQGLMLVEIDY
jgi:tRNA pseudouridine38-40 synthase